LLLLDFFVNTVSSSNISVRAILKDGTFSVLEFELLFVVNALSSSSYFNVGSISSIFLAIGKIGSVFSSFSYLRVGSKCSVLYFRC